MIYNPLIADHTPDDQYLDDQDVAHKSQDQKMDGKQQATFLTKLYAYVSVAPPVYPVVDQSLVVIDSWSDKNTNT